MIMEDNSTPDDRTQQQDMALNPDFRFSDETILEANGEYANCVNIMECEKPSQEWKTITFAHTSEKWVLISRLTLIHLFGISDFMLEFHHDKKVIIASFMPSTREPSANFDIRCLASWCFANGWDKPQPSINMVKDMLGFWKHMWQVNSVDCPYLDDKYGKRPGDENENTAASKSKP
jgi:hypothetical protein